MTLTVRMDYGDNSDEKKIKQVSIVDNVKVDKFIAEEHWDNLIGLDHTKAYDELASKLQHIYKSSQRTVTIKQRKKDKPWLTQEIMELSYPKERLYRRSKANSAGEILKHESRQMRNKLTAKIRLAKNNYYKNKLNNCRKDIRKSWQLVNSLTGRKPKDDIDEVITINFPERQAEELANDFNNCFADAVRKLRSQSVIKQSQIYSPKSNMRSAYLPDITEQEIWEIIRTFSINRIPGYDGIRIRDLVVHFEKLKALLMYIFSKILETGKIPRGMKISLIRPVFKQGKKDQCEN